MPENTTVVIRHFPPSYTKEERVEFMKTFNAIEVKCLISKFKKQSLVFAKFNTRREAEAVIKHLHQTELDGYYLSLEFARGSDHSNFGKDFDAKSFTDYKDDQTSQHRILEEFLSRLNSWSRHLDFRHPPPHHLSYQYPRPTLLVLSNIAKAMAAVPKFYTQVLHLMNKMCLPCPFTENYSITSDLVPGLLRNLSPGMEKKIDAVSSDSVLQEEDSCDESEIESDPDTSVTTTTKIAFPKRTLNPKSRPKVKRLRLVKVPTLPKQEKVGQLVKPEEVFELTSQNTLNEPRKIEVKLISDLNAVAANSNEQEIIGEEFEKIGPTEKPKAERDIDENIEENNEMDNSQKIITEEELAMNRISSRDQHMLPVFKNYQPGLPSCRLYLKNLAKNVEQADLSYIYRRFYLEKEDEQGTMFDIRLMQEGRMKGQAFITLQNEKQAELALKQTNGYILKGKPIVVQFARAKPK